MFSCIMKNKVKENLGYARDKVCIYGGFEVFLAQAGVIPESRSPAQFSGRLPRTSRDDPIQGAVQAMGLAMSPHKQG